MDNIAFNDPDPDRHSGEAGGSPRSDNSGEMSLSCTVATTRDDESLTPICPGLTQYAGLGVKRPCLLTKVSHRLLGPNIESKSYASLTGYQRPSLSLSCYKLAGQ